MDAACTIQDSIHVFSLVRKYVSRILGTYQNSKGDFYYMFLIGNIKVQVNLPHLPTSANFHQDITLHILMAHQLQEMSKHILIQV